MSEGCLEVTDGVLFYETCGAGEPIVCIHGHFNDHQIWEEQMKTFSGNYLVVSYDLRGYGNSETPRASFSNVDDLRLLLDTLKVDKVDLVGSSMGGSVAVDFSLAYPDRVHPLILAAPSINGRNYPASMFWQGIKQHIQIRLNGRWKAIEAFIAHPFWQYYFPDRTNESARQKPSATYENPKTSAVSLHSSRASPGLMPFIDWRSFIVRFSSSLANGITLLTERRLIF